MLDVRSVKLSSPAVILIENGLIADINPPMPAIDAEVIDLGKRTLISGLIDMHTHITGDYFTGED